MDKDAVKAMLVNIKKNLRVTKVVATRSVKTNRGDFFAGISAAWNSVQDDAGGPGADLDLTVSGNEITLNGMSLTEARIAHYLVAMQADIAAYDAAFANGAISQTELNDATTAVKHNYGRLIQAALIKNGNNGSD